MRSRETKPRLLVIDDSPAIRDAVIVALGRDSYQYAYAENGRVGLAVAFSERPDLILLDKVLPEMNGIECCAALKSHLFTRNIPILMLTAEDDPEDVVRGLEAGADDYVAKPFNPRELRARVASLLKRTQRYVDTDPLTKLPGNAQLREELFHRLALGETMAVCYIDLDEFKAYVDTYGFQQASRVIQQTARVCYDQMVERGDDGDFIGHIGGDDFVVITSTEKMQAVCEGIIEAFERTRDAFYNAEDLERGYLHGHDREGQERDFPLMTLSIAVLLTGPERIDDLDDLAGVAARAKMQLKRLPGSNWRVYDPSS